MSVRYPNIFNGFHSTAATEQKIEKSKIENIELPDTQDEELMTFVVRKKKIYRDVFYKSVERHAKRLQRDEGVQKYLSRTDIHDPEAIQLAQEIDEYDFREENKTKLAPSQVYALFVTLSPEPGSCTPEQLLDTAKAITKPKSGILSSIFSIEQSGTEKAGNVGYHPHLHILLVRNTASGPSGEFGKLKAMVTRHCSRYKTKSDVYLQIKPVSLKSYKSKLDYVMGKKTDPSKQDQLTADNLWRQSLSIEQFYTSSPLAGVN